MPAAAKDIDAYIKSLPDDRKEAVAEIRKVILRHLPKGYEENFTGSMICYEVPLTIEPNTYNKKPLMYAALANQKNHIGVYMCGLYCVKGAEEKFRKASKAPRKLDMGKSCIRAKKLEDLDLKLIGESIASMGVKNFVAASNKN